MARRWPTTCSTNGSCSQAQRHADAFEQPFHSVDLIYSYFPTEQLTLKFRARNLLDEERSRQNGVTIIEQSIGIVFKFDVSYKFSPLARAGILRAATRTAATRSAPEANDRANARKLLTAAEFKLFEASRRDAICKLDARTLKLKVELTRKRRDKYRDLYKRQRLAIRDQTGTKRGNSGAANARTKEKAALFEELRARFQARYFQVTAPPARTAKGKSPPKTMKPAVPLRGRARPFHPRPPPRAALQP